MARRNELDGSFQRGNAIRRRLILPLPPTGELVIAGGSLLWFDAPLIFALKWTARVDDENG